MPDIHVLGGDFPKAKGSYGLGKLYIKTGKLNWLGQNVTGLLIDVQPITARTKKSIRDAFGLGAIGSLFYGNAGFIMGLILGGNKSEASFVGTLSDGRRFIAKAKPGVVDKLVKIALRNASALAWQERHTDGSIPMSMTPPDDSIPMD